MKEQQEGVKPVTKFEVSTTVPGFIEHAGIISALRAKYHGVEYDVSNATGMAKAIFARKELRDARLALDKRKPEIKREALDFCAKVEADYKEIRASVCEYEEIPDAAIKADEARKEAIKAEAARVEAERKAAIQLRISKILDLVLGVAGKSSGDVEIYIARVKAAPIGADFQEFQQEAESARGEVVSKLQEVYAALVRAEETAAQLKAEQEAESERLKARQAEIEAAAEIERKRAAEEQAERDKAHAIEVQRLADEKAKQDAIQAEREEGNRKANEELSRLRAAEIMRRQEEEDKARAEREAADRLAAEERAKQQAIIDAERAELKKQQDEAAAEQAERDRLAKERADEESASQRKADEVKRQVEHEEKLKAATADYVTTLRSILDACNDDSLTAPSALLLVSELAKRGLGVMG